MKNIIMTCRQMDYESELRPGLRIIVDNSVSPDDVLVPEYHLGASRPYRKGAELTIMPENMAWYGRYFIRSVEHNMPILEVLEMHVFDKDGIALTPESVNDIDLPEGSPVIVHHIAGKGYQVIRCSDNHVVQSNIINKADAEKAAKEYIKKFTQGLPNAAAKK